MVKKVPQFQNNVDTRKKLTAVVVISALLRDLQNPQRNHHHDHRNHHHHYDHDHRYHDHHYNHDDCEG